MACHLLFYIQEVKFLFQSGKNFLASFRLNDGQTKNAYLVLKCLVWWHTQNFKRCWGFNKSQTWYNIVLHVIYLHCLFGILVLVYHSSNYIYIYFQAMYLKKRTHIKTNVMFLKCEWFIVLNNLTTIVGFKLHLAIYGENKKHFIFLVSLNIIV